MGGKIGKLRGHIDHIDLKIIQLLDERAQVAATIGSSKRASGDATFAPDREDRVLQRAESHARGNFPRASARAVFREIVSGCRSVQAGLTVAFLGPEGTFTHAATLERFGGTVSLLACGSIPMVFREVEREAAHFGVVPAENSTEGVVHHTLDRLVDTELTITGEVVLPIEHCLLGAPNLKEQHIETIFSHPQALGQCSAFLDAHFPDCQLVGVPSTAEAARRVQHRHNAAAIASAAAANAYGLTILRHKIQDAGDNQTRFFVIGRDMAKPSEQPSKTSLILSLHDRPGSLYDMLGVFAKAGINLTRIQSRPSQQSTWDYVFFVDLEGHVQDPDVSDAIAKLRSYCQCRVAGSYPLSAT